MDANLLWIEHGFDIGQKNKRRDNEKKLQCNMYHVIL